MKTLLQDLIVLDKIGFIKILQFKCLVSTLMNKNKLKFTLFKGYQLPLGSMAATKTGFFSMTSNRAKCRSKFRASRTYETSSDFSDSCSTFRYYLIRRSAATRHNIMKPYQYFSRSWSLSKVKDKEGYSLSST